MCEHKPALCCPQALLEAVKVGDTHIRMLTPAVLRQSLRKAGKVVKPSEVAAILEYVISDEQFEDLHGLYLAHLHNGDVTRLSWQGKQEDQMGAEKLFIACNKRSSELLELMCFDKAILLEPSAAWEKLARCQPPPPPPPPLLTQYLLVAENLSYMCLRLLYSIQ